MTRQYRTARFVETPASDTIGLARRTIVVPHGLGAVNVNAVIPSGADAIERVSGQHRMTAIPVDVRPAQAPVDSLHPLTYS